MESFKLVLLNFAFNFLLNFTNCSIVLKASLTDDYTVPDPYSVVELFYYGSTLKIECRCNIFDSGCNDKELTLVGPRGEFPKKEDALISFTMEINSGTDLGEYYCRDETNSRSNTLKIPYVLCPNEHIFCQTNPKCAQHYYMCFINYNVIDDAQCGLMNNKFCDNTTNIAVYLQEIISLESERTHSFCNMYAVVENYIPLYYCYAVDFCYHTNFEIEINGIRQVIGSVMNTFDGTLSIKVSQFRDQDLVISYQRVNLRIVSNGKVVQKRVYNGANSIVVFNLNNLNANRSVRYKYLLHSTIGPRSASFHFFGYIVVFSDDISIMQFPREFDCKASLIDQLLCKFCDDIRDGFTYYIEWRLNNKTFIERKQTTNSIIKVNQSGTYECRGYVRYRSCNPYAEFNDTVHVAKYNVHDGCYYTGEFYDDTSTDEYFESGDDNVFIAISLWCLAAVVVIAIISFVIFFKYKQRQLAAKSSKARFQSSVSSGKRRKKLIRTSRSTSKGRSKKFVRFSKSPTRRSKKVVHSSQSPTTQIRNKKFVSSSKSPAQSRSKKVVRSSKTLKQHRRKMKR